MAYSDSVLRRAKTRLQRQRQAHQARQRAQQEKIFQQLPQVLDIHRQLRRTAPKLAEVILRPGPDSAAALEELRRENLALQDREAALLDQAGYPVDALDQTPFCPLCKDRGWVGSEMCACLRTLCQEEQIKELSSLLDLKGQSFETFRLDYYDREIPQGRRRSPMENMQMVLTICRRYAELFGDGPRQNLLFFGPPGLGKTFLSACIARVVSDRGFSVVYDSAPNVFARFEAKKFAAPGEDPGQAAADTRRYLTCDLLILDDLGTEFVSPFVQSVLYELINTRLIEGTQTIISTNLDRPQMEQRYSPQIFSRLEGEYSILPFYGRDIRLIKKNEPIVRKDPAL